jgi:hypothetical protein
MLFESEEISIRADNVPDGSRAAEALYTIFFIAQIIALSEYTPDTLDIQLDLLTGAVYFVSNAHMFDSPESDQRQEYEVVDFSISPEGNMNCLVTGFSDASYFTFQIPHNQTTQENRQN